MIFLTSRNDNIYKFLINIFSKKFFKNKKIKENIIHFKILKKYDYLFLLNFITKILFLRVLSKNDIVRLKFRNVNYGRFLISVIYKDVRSYDSNRIFYFNLIKNVIIISRFYSTASYLIKNYNVGAVYLDHCMYLNGILFEIFRNERKVLYANNYPKDLIEIRPSNKNFSIQDCFKLYKKNKKIEEKKIKVIKKLQNQILKGKKIFYPWMINTKYKNKKFENFGQFDYVVYSHSFTDAQLIWGYDGFVNAYEWLDFTIKNLVNRNKNVLVKAHPNFYLKNTKLCIHERYLFKKIISKYRLNKRISFLNVPVSNYDVMSRLNKKCIAITHHGSVGLELLLNNFKVINSVCNFYDKKFNLSNQWSNKNDYEKILNLDWHRLKHHKQFDLLKICNQLFLSETGYLSKNYHEKILFNYLVKKKIVNRLSSVEGISQKFELIKNKDKFLENLKADVHSVKI